MHYAIFVSIICFDKLLQLQYKLNITWWSKNDLIDILYRNFQKIFYLK